VLDEAINDVAPPVNDFVQIFCDKFQLLWFERRLTGLVFWQFAADEDSHSVACCSAMFETIPSPEKQRRA
jgi:hypothetical protein